MNTLTVTLTDTRVIDGWVAAANANGYTPEDLALEFLQQQGKSYADLNKIGIITGAAFMARFTPAEYGAILAAAQPDPDATEDEAAVAAQIQQLLAELFAAHTVPLDDARLMPGLQLLVSAGLLDAERPAEILFYARPFPQVNDTTEPDGGDDTTDPLVDDDTTDLLVDDGIALLPDGGDV